MTDGDDRPITDEDTLDMFIGSGVDDPISFPAPFEFRIDLGSTDIMELISFRFIGSSIARVEVVAVEDSPEQTVSDPEVSCTCV